MRYILVMLTCIFLYSCNGDNSIRQAPVKKKDVLYNQVMEVHDAVMPRMSDIHALKKELRKHLNKEKYKEEILDQIQELDEADDAMMDWMHDLNVPEKGGFERNQYLQKELKEIEEVRDIMLQSIENAENLVDKLKVSPDEN